MRTRCCKGVTSWYSFKAYESEEIEAKEVAGQILTLLNKGVKASEIAVLYRINRTNYEQGVAQHFAAFKQRYVTGREPAPAPRNHAPTPAATM